MPSSLIARACGLVALLVAAAATQAAPVAPFQAEYEVLRNGKPLGQATLALRESGDDTWEFREQTRGTRGMASLVGLDVTETSTFRWRDDRPEGLRYEYAQHAAIKSRERSTEFDWNAHEARSRDGKRSWTAPLERGAMDRSVVTVALMAAMKSGAGDLTFPVVDKDHVAEQHWHVAGDDGLSLRSGPVRAVRIERVRDDANKKTTIWLAPHLAWLPVQIEQTDKDGVVTMRFVHGS
jgi:hypothetical protein